MVYFEVRIMRVTYVCTCSIDFVERSCLALVLYSVYVELVLRIALCGYMYNAMCHRLQLRFLVQYNTLPCFSRAPNFQPFQRVLQNGTNPMPIAIQSLFKFLYVPTQHEQSIDNYQLCPMITKVLYQLLLICAVVSVQHYD